MAWTISLKNLDSDHDLAICQAVWEPGTPDEFIYQERVRRTITVEEVSALRQRADTERLAASGKRTWMTSIRDTIQSLFRA